VWTFCIRGILQFVLILILIDGSYCSCFEGFFGCKHFSKTNAILEKEGQQPIDWRLDDWTPQLSEKTSSENKDSVTPSTTSSSQSESKQASNAHNNQKNKISDKQTKSNK
jgi:hypothetical protein